MRTRWSGVRSLAAALIAMTACTTDGSPSSTPSARPSGSSSPVPVATTLADGRTLPEGCPNGRVSAEQTVTFVAGGNAWALDPSAGEVGCLFVTADPGPFAWNPRGDRALLADLAIRSISGAELRAASLPASVTSWGHPIGKAVVYVSEDERHLRKAYPGTQRHDDVTPIGGVRYLNVIYHPSGLALAFVVDTGDGQEIWLSSNLGEDPVRLVFATGGTTFGSLGFTLDGRLLLYGAVHGDDAPLLHAIDLTEPTMNQSLWHGEPGDRITSIDAQPTRSGRLIALTVGSGCEDARALLVRRGAEARVLADAPARAVGWLDDHTVLVATGGCGEPLDLAAVDVGQDATAPLVAGVDVAAVRLPLPDFVPTLPSGIEEEVGAGVG